MNLYLSINTEGTLSLWDDEERRQSGAPNEAHLDLELSERQAGQIGKAWIESKDKRDKIARLKKLEERQAARNKPVAPENVKQAP